MKIDDRMEFNLDLNVEGFAKSFGIVPESF